MRTYLSFIVTLSAWFFAPNTLDAQSDKTIDFVGGARSFTANNNLNVQSSIPDTTTVKRNTSGYALIDLGVNLRPNKNVEILGMFRIRNDYGGFWGAGTSFTVRQLWLKGIIGNVLRYQLGDLNLRQTPFTLYNHHADRIDSLPTIFKLQNDIVSYEKFYQKNTWRQQGATIDFGLKFAKVLQEVNVMGYLTRLQASNFTTVPDRLMGGTTINLVQSQYFKIGYNNLFVFDLAKTTPDSNLYSNTVHSLSPKFNKNFGENKLEVKAELGQSQVQYSQQIAQSKLTDNFIHATAKFTMPKFHLELAASYLNVGPDFRSIGAQSKNINYNNLPNFYNRIGNDKLARPLDLMDIIRNDNLYNTSVTANLMPINPLYNNILPYGITTFNRQGVIVQFNYLSPKGLYFKAEQAFLSEIRGQGTLNLKTFTQTKLNSQIELHKLLKLKRQIKIQLGMNYQTTERSSTLAVENVNLKTLQYQAGLEIEVLPNIDLLGGIVSTNTNGNDFIPERNNFSTIQFFNNTNYNINQQLWALGARCRFSHNIYLTALYQTNTYDNRLDNNTNYSISQFAIIYNMLF
jgi:hypothetical protein